MEESDVWNMNDYEAQLAKWKENHGVDPNSETNQDELAMAAEEQASKLESWCLGCDKKMPISQMKLITRSIDPYVQIDGTDSDYISKGNRVRMCPQCFEEHYP